MERVRKLSVVMHYAGACMVICTAVLVTFDVLSRYLLGRPFHGTPEIVATMLVIITFMQAPYSIIHEKLLRVTVIFGFVSRNAARVLNCVSYSAGILFFLVLFFTSWGAMVESLSSGEFFGTDAFRIPAWPSRVGTTFLWLLGALVSAIMVVRAWKGQSAPGTN